MPAITIYRPEGFENIAEYLNNQYDGSDGLLEFSTFEC